MAIHITSHTKSLQIRPTSKAELRSLIKQELQRQGPDADLNFIDTSKITDMSNLFWSLNVRKIKIEWWNVSNVTNMSGMFSFCYDFNCDLSHWDVRNVKNLDFMFHGCSKLRCDLSGWKPCTKHISWVTFDGCDCMPIEFRLPLR